jgi:hypothetical protein
MVKGDELALARTMLSFDVRVELALLTVIAVATLPLTCRLE